MLAKNKETKKCQNVSSAVQVVLVHVVKVHIRSMNMLVWMKKNVFFAVLLPMVHVAKVLMENINMVVEPINVFIVVLPAQVSAARVPMGDMKSKSSCSLISVLQDISLLLSTDLSIKNILNIIKIQYVIYKRYRMLIMPKVKNVEKKIWDAE